MKKFFTYAIIALLALPLVIAGCKKGEGDPFISFKSRDGRITGTWSLTSFNSDTTETVVIKLSNDVNNDGETTDKTKTSSGVFSNGSLTLTRSTDSTGVTTKESWDDPQNTPANPGDDVAVTTTTTTVRNYDATINQDMSVTVTINKDNTYTATMTRTHKSKKSTNKTTINGTPVVPVTVDTTYSPQTTVTWEESGTWFWLDSKDNKIEIVAGPLTGMLFQLKNKELIIEDTTEDTDQATVYDNVSKESFSNPNNQTLTKKGVQTWDYSTKITIDRSETWTKQD